ncbi:MAG: EAL domain-containing protein [Candidatus Thiodiazotropha weberae]|nr:EAL domain-containing protein [Candidatus Thiodiazotropha lotti]MCG8010113.1 EAL domain-containing protein [Candidatus Thiodiazotropha lotti]MCW4209571.1 EAL domain-containing protein [Candidatus Thiodiazotropha lotti]MCW4215598.1 EAL domain-containing protein [Candidatus Thiodiazotropha lotti]
MKIRTTIFRHLYIRMAIILLCISLAFSFALIPVYNDKLSRMLAAQGSTFTNTTIAACGEALYTADYSFVINYTKKVLKETPEVTFVNFISSDGMRLNISQSGWGVETVGKDQTQVKRPSEQPYSLKHYTEIPETGIRDAFLFNKPLVISGLLWGDIEIGISDSEYNSLMLSYFRNVILYSFVLLAISLLILHGVSIKLSSQLSKLRQTASLLSNGDLSARAPTEAIGEISLLATTLNNMAFNLETKTNRVEQLARLVEDTDDAIAIFDKSHQISFINNAFANITGQNIDNYQGMTLQELFQNLDIDKRKQHEIALGFEHVKQLNWSTDITISKLSNPPTHLTLRIERFDSANQEESSFFVVLSDITQRKQLEQELETLAYIDKLTKLPNRRYFMDALTANVKDATLSDTSLAVFFLDLDNFKLINDSLGHEVGDHVLNEAAWKLQDSLRSDDIVCRLGGDEFTVILKNVTETEKLATIADSILASFSTPILCNKRELRITTSIGIVQFPQHGNDEMELIKNADTAMYAAKHSGKNSYRFFTSDMHRDMKDYLELESALRSAIIDSNLEIVYQPFIDIETNRITNCEALLRWNHPQRGLIPPGRFIPIAEQSGLISEVGNWVFTEVCRQIKTWDNGINVSINVSGNELADKTFINRLEKTLVEYDIDPYRIQLEFTEHVLVSKDGSNLPILNALKRAGFAIAIDDFGTGFSSLSYISELPIDTIKIDKTFINKLPYDRRTIAVVNSIISLAKNLDLKTVGEGVEKKEQVDWLQANGCNTIQGYYHHRPMSAQDLQALIKPDNLRLMPTISNQYSKPGK